MLPVVSPGFTTWKVPFAATVVPNHQDTFSDGNMDYVHLTLSHHGKVGCDFFVWKRWDDDERCFLFVCFFHEYAEMINY